LIYNSKLLSVEELTQQRYEIAMSRLLLSDEHWSKLRKILLHKTIYNKRDLRMTVERLLCRMCTGYPEREAFGMTAHIGVDDESGLVHIVMGTAANVADVTQVDKMLHGAQLCRCRLNQRRETYQA
jgi:IS5 family transposase